MTYEALARKWRPQTFDDIVEQPQVTQTLANAIATGRIHHAYLFCGPRGTGKTTTARILAKALNCETGPTPTPCNKCLFCTGITNGSNMDVLEIDAASNTGVDDIRDLRESARYVPAASRYKIYIIDEIHRLSPSAFDALLKTLEEPPPSVIFVFATTEANKVPPTVRSRTLRFDFRLISHEALRGALTRIAAAEKIEIDGDAVSILATEASGSLRDAQSLLDQLAGYTGGLITSETVGEALGLVDTTVLFDLTDAFAAHDLDRSLELIASVSRAGRDLKQFSRQLAEHIKRLLFARALGNNYADESLNKETTAKYAVSGSQWAENDLLRLLTMTLEVANRWERSAHPRLEFELLAMRASRMDRSVDVQALVDHLRSGAPAPANPSLAARGSTGFQAPPARPNTAPSRPQASALPPPPRPSSHMPAPNPRPTARPEPATGTATATTTAPEPVRAAAAAGARLNFAPILESICQTRPTLQAILGEAQLVKSGAGTADLNVYNGSVFHQKQLAQKPIRDLIQAEITRALGEGLRVTIHVKSEGPSSPGNGSPAEKSPARSAGGQQQTDDPNLQAILRRFDGEIVG